MINIFKRLAPAYGRILREFALDVWYDRADPLEFFRKAERYRRRYVRDLSEHYRALGMHYRPAEINRLSEQWLQDQIITAQKVQSVSQEKKNRLSEEMDKLITEKRVEVKRLLDGSAKPEGRVSPVIAFSDNFEAKAMQMGEQAAFDLSTEINHAVVQGISDVYVWTSQEDARVRKTHRMLNGKKFSFNSPPTTIDEYGHRHTGNPGTDWGCRCWEEPSTGRPLIGYVADARRK